MEGTTATTPTFSAIEIFNGKIYAIVRQNNSKELKMVIQPYTLNHNPTERELRNYHRYAPDMNCAYSDCLPLIPYGRPLCESNVRRRAIAMMDTIDAIKRNEDVVACSHRYGGWTAINWNFGEDVKFTISTNFGYGSCSYFHLLIMYKDHLLTPYTDYIRYRYSDFSTLHRYTHAYALDEAEWENVMKDALNFYNAVVYKREGYIFSWLINHLERMTSGIEKLRTAISFSFDSPCHDSTTQVSGDELTLVKANKIANSLDFIGNISVLPVQVTPKRYVDRILSVCRTHLSELIALLDKLEDQNKNEKERLKNLTSDADYATFAEIRKRCYYRLNWHYVDRKRSMFRLLLRMQHRYMPYISRKERRNRIEALRLLIKEIEETQKNISNLEHMISNLSSCRNKIEKYFEKEQSKTA